MKNFLKPLLILFVTSGLLFSADLIRVQPLTDTIVCLTFDEGHIDYFSLNQDRYNGNKVYFDAMDVDNAMQTANYLITSTDDAQYKSPQNPVAVGRKSRGMDFHHIYDNNNPAVIKNHWVYVELPHALVQGSTYTVQLNDVAGNMNSYTFTYDYQKLRSPAVHVNQIGFVPQSKKYAYLSHFMGDFDNSTHKSGALDLADFEGKAFHLLNTETNDIAFTGEITFHKDKTNHDFNTSRGFTDKNMTRASIWECEFSDFDTPGRYIVAIPGMGCSYPFEIDENIYREPFYATSRAMFYQRAGIIQEIEPGFEYPRDHHPDDGVKMYYFPNLHGEDSFDVNNAEGPIDGVWGWYHDAGDWDGYTHHYRVPMTLLSLYDLKPENFGDGDINQTYKESEAGEWIQEGENGIPDLLDEAMWLVKYYKRVKERMIAHGYSDGGVPGYVGVDAGAEIPSWEDKRDQALKGADIVQNTFHYAASAAWLAICLNKSVDGEHPDSPQWITEAQEAYAWSKAKNKGAESSVNRAQEEASAALFRATGEILYQDDFRDCVTKDGDFGKSSVWFSVNPWQFAAGIFSLIPDDFPGLDISLKQKCVDAIVNKSFTNDVQTANQHGFRYSTDSDINFMLGVFSTPRIYLAALAYELTGEQHYLDACYSSCDYVLGGNQLDLVKITRVGDNPEPHVFHPDSWFMINYDSPVYTNNPLPGYVLYEMHKNSDWMSGDKGDIGNGWSWIGDEDFSRSTAYPHIDDFPDAEARFHNRNSIAGSEWTIHQNLCQAIFAYGYLCGKHSAPYTQNEVPTIVLNVEPNIQIPLDAKISLTSTGSADVERVEYYLNWQFIGESCDIENGFAFGWDLAKYNFSRGTKTITAKAFDKNGQLSRPDENGSVKVRLVKATSVDDAQGNLPVDFKFGQNYPNPFNPDTTLSYSLPESGFVSIKVYDVLGDEVAVLVSEDKPVGYHTVDFDASEFSSGVYFAVMKSGDFKQNVKMLYTK